MSDNSKSIVFSETKQDKESIQTSQNQHWVDLAKKVSIKPELLNKITIPNLSGRPDKMNERVDGWIKPQTAFGESIDPTNKIGNLKYLSRVIYSEMYQISVPSEDGNVGVMSLGGVITHVEFDEELNSELQHKNKFTRSTDESYLLFSLNCRKSVDDKIGPELNKQISVESSNSISNALGHSIPEEPMSVEAIFKLAWENLRIEEPEILKTSNTEKLQKYVEKLIQIRSIPEFQFIFTSPFWFEAVNNVQAKNDNDVITN